MSVIYPSIYSLKPSLIIVIILRAQSKLSSGSELLSSQTVLGKACGFNFITLFSYLLGEMCATNSLFLNNILVVITKSFQEPH